MNQHDLPRGSRRNVLLIHPGALGDVLLARPALQALTQRFPQHEIAFLGGREVGLLLQACEEVHRVFPIESAYLSEVFAGVDHLSQVFLDWLEQTDMVVGWLSDTEGAAASTLRAVGVRSIQFQPALSSNRHVSEHQSDRYCEAARLESSGSLSAGFLALPSTIRGQGNQVLAALDLEKHDQLVVIHPGSGSGRKCLESWRLVRVIEWMSAFGAAPLLLEGPADEKAVAAVLSGLTHAVPVVRGMNVSVVAGVLSHAALYVGHDSGITHLAAALAVPTIACFGPTNPRRWAPRGTKVTIMTGPPCACLTWRDVEGCGERACLQITPERIIDASRAYLGERPSPRVEKS